MQTQLVALALRFALGQLKKHPEILKDVADKIPGKIDDLALSFLLKLI